MKDYCKIVDKAMGHNMYSHRTLRTCLDPGSSEWDNTDMETKINILKKVSDTNDLELILLYYKAYYRELKKEHVADNVESGLLALLLYTMNKN